MFYIACVLMGLLIVVYGILRGCIVYKKMQICRKMKKGGPEA